MYRSRSVIVMKKYLVLLCGIIFALVCVCCEEEEDFGYPSKIILPDKGDKIIFNGSDAIPYVHSMELLDHDGNGNSGTVSESGDPLTVTTEWLTVESSPTDNRITLIAEPNGTKKDRKLYLYLYSGYSRQEITVIQQKQ